MMVTGKMGRGAKAAYLGGGEGITELAVHKLKYEP